MKGSFRACANLSLDCDAVIIGSGAGGSCVADVFTRGGMDVVMIEEGSYTAIADASYRATEAFPRSWRNGGLTAALGKPNISYAEGRCVGGGTEINSAIFQRTSDQVLDGWAGRYAIDSFSAEALKPYYERAASTVNASLTAEPLGRASDILKDGADKLGWKTTALERAQRSGANMCSFVCPTAGKQSMTATLLPDAIARGMRLIADCRVNRVEMSGTNATVVRAIATGADGCAYRVTVRAKTIVLAAGAVQTPAILQRSGFKGSVGASLRLHPTVKALALFEEPVDAHLSPLPLYAVSEFMPEQRIGGSLFSPAFYAMSLSEDWANRAHLLADWRHAGMYYGMIRPTGVGRVRALPFCSEPFVTYALTQQDWGSLFDILQATARVLFAAGAKFVMPSIAGHKGWRSEGEMLDEMPSSFTRERVSLMSIHLFSSCPLGEAATSVTDSFGRLRSATNILIADGSLIPEAPGVNPQATIMALAYRAAEHWLATSEIKRGARASRDR